MKYEIDHNEAAAILALPLSTPTQKLVDELRALIGEREKVNPEIARVMAKAATMDTDAAVEKITPLRVRQEVVCVKLAAKRQAVMAAIVKDSAKWQETTEAEVESARINAMDVKAAFAEKVRAAFSKADAARMLKGGNAAGSDEVRKASVRSREAMEQGMLACVCRKLIDRDRSVELDQAGAAMGCTRPNVMPPEWYWRNAALLAPELVD